MKIHLLLGDAVVETFRKTNVAGEIVICRECLIEGEIGGDTPEEFWRTRAGFIAKTYDGDEKEYFRTVASEFEKLANASRESAEINLWFEYELFCQVNFWFTLYFLRASEAKIFRVAPVTREEAEIWKGFGGMSAEDLETCFARRVELSPGERARGADLWKAFQSADHETLERLSETESAAFPRLGEVCRAAIERDSRPRAVLEEIIAGGEQDFTEIFSRFAARAGVYGFGDSQVRRILAEVGR